jgi:hypothetical protein
MGQLWLEVSVNGIVIPQSAATATNGDVDDTHWECGRCTLRNQTVPAYARCAAEE